MRFSFIFKDLSPNPIDVRGIFFVRLNEAFKMQKHHSI
ncbi:hypothetical protein GGR08_000194 [Bartonella fuyuanensis]|uniref:Uncharacterized protein n=1 Tax=Bartonella fuyuanensis TaxID=1460968 RepID=A0A840DW73_9HYPH|nr:hypothetical protein [Bartonella fuyuanensis]